MLSANDLDGGAARAAYRLHKALLKQGVNSMMLVNRKSSDDDTIIGPQSKKQKLVNVLRPSLDKVPLIFRKNHLDSPFSTAWLKNDWVLKKIKEINPDIVHLHWVCWGLLKIEDLTRLNKPMIWTLHDNWPFTGGCHIKWDCEEYKNKCGRCPKLESNNENDLSRKIWARKFKTFSKIDNLMVVAPSRWIMRCSQESGLLNKFNHVNLPNLIDTRVFKPFDKYKSRELWSLPKEKKLILFGAINGTSDPNKGYKQLIEALDKLDIRDVELVIFGNNQPANNQKFKYKTHFMGKLYDDISLVTLYSAVDVFVMPSLQEAFGQTAVESMSCGTPVVCFKTSGLLDIVDHNVNGYLAKMFDSVDLANGIKHILLSKNYNYFCANARNKVVNKFDSQLVVQQYIKLYNDILI